MFKVIYDTISLQKTLQSVKQSGLRTGFVPTMGALHQGHLKLVERCVAENDICVVSIYVNPTQFNNRSDLINYPSVLDDDIEKLKNAGAHIVFAPTDEDMYPHGKKLLTNIDLEGMDKILEGEFRPGHFVGVVTVVKLLFDKVKPDKAYFGLKDYQQLMVIKMMVKKLNIPVQICDVPIVREPDGLAMSSRNLLLSDKERALAPKINQTLIDAQKLLQSNPVDFVTDWVKKELSSDKLFKFEYFEIRDAETLKSISGMNDATKIILLVAVWVGKIRLIDNLMIN